MSALPTVSIIIPIYQEVATLSQRIPDLLALQAHAEVLLCDGGSEDGSVALLEASPLSCVASSAGRARQMNTAAAQAQGDVLLFVHIDTLLDAKHIRAVQEAMQDDAVVGGRFDVRLSGKHPMFRIIERAINLRSRWTGISTGDQCQFIRRSLFEDMGGFPDIPLMEDVALAQAMKQCGKQAYLRQAVETSSRRWEKHGVMKTVLLMWKLRWLYWRGVAPEVLVRMYR